MLDATSASTATAEESEMQAFIAATVAATSHGYPDWVKIAARAAFLLLFLAGATWVAMSWLTLRGFDTL